MMSIVVERLAMQKQGSTTEASSRTTAKLDAVVDFAAVDGRTMRRHPDCRHCPCKNFMPDRSPEIKHCANCRHVH